MDSSEERMNPVKMTIINPEKEYIPGQELNQRPPILKSGTLLTELWGLAIWFAATSHSQVWYTTD